MKSWFRRSIGLLAIILLLALPEIAQQSQPTTQPAQAPTSGNLEAEGANNSLSPEAQDKLIREVRHELIMLPYYNVFDNLLFKVDGRTVVFVEVKTRRSEEDHRILDLFPAKPRERFGVLRHDAQNPSIRAIQEWFVLIRKWCAFAFVVIAHAQLSGK